ncbi:MAG: HEAT repeat domain-containing protein, partial [Caldilinea sp.]|nr:HEAT repeat domain-containing protein [Caldilinea sp.]MDW8440477.1 HEAT repeat domain-containing protein [Caldilineaceae bacterium]
DEPALIELLSSPEENERWWALRALAACGSANAAAPIARCLDDPVTAVRAAAALALAHLHRRYPSEVTPLLEQVAARLADEEGMVRQIAADALAMCGDDAVPALARILFEQRHEGARTRAASALRKMATRKAASILYALLNDPNPLVRTYAYEGLDEMGLLETILVTLK